MDSTRQDETNQKLNTGIFLVNAKVDYIEEQLNSGIDEVNMN